MNDPLPASPFAGGGAKHPPLRRVGVGHKGLPATSNVPGSFLWRAIPARHPDGPTLCVVEKRSRRFSLPEVFCAARHVSCLAVLPESITVNAYAQSNSLFLLFSQKDTSVQGYRV
ncbi:hypothetical protein DDT54_17235 [Brenneria nigrifluens DSM 30175 = ATCC 13028]|uniref:Uncharacterized protein n=1 Tax=Brenneria nigrifluens DSM 30175 = ATCC 13028 TaxID=1121120 RepID=A0A2U1ULK6_9GAMM|nr:hypothetical protein DDT54_17235 [Brenneria nigrifluens DSM 30175 = ATCC 13028]